MDNIIHIGAKVEKEDADNFSGAIVSIFESAHKNHMEQDTVQKAISAFASIFEVKHVTVTNSSFIGEDKRTIVNHCEDEETP